MSKPITVSAYGKTFNFPAGTSVGEIESTLNDNEHLLNPEWRAPEGFEGVAKNVVTGAKQTGRMVGATVDAARNNLSGVEDYARESSVSAEQNMPIEQRKLMGEFKEIKDRDQGEAGKFVDVLKAAGKNPMGTVQMVAEQVPNTAISLGGGYAGFKTGAAAGSLFGPVGAAIGGTIGFVSGMFLGNVLLEAGGKAIEKASDEDGFTPQDRDTSLREGAVKAAVITGVDAATFKIGGMLANKMGGSAIQAGAKAETKVLMDAGVDVTSLAAINAALKSSPELYRTAKVAGEKAVLQSLSTGKKAAIIGSGVALETASEGVGEYAGEYAATGKGDVVDATIEALSSATMSVAETAYNYNKVAIGNDLSPEGIKKVADNINERDVNEGVSNINKASSVDEAIKAANDVVSRKPTTSDDVLSSIDPTLKDIERLTGLKPSDAVAQVINGAQQAQDSTQLQSQAKSILSGANVSIQVPQPNEVLNEEEITKQKTGTAKSSGILGKESEIVLPDGAANPLSFGKTGGSEGEGNGSGGYVESISNIGISKTGFSQGNNSGVVESPNLRNNISPLKSLSDSDIPNAGSFVNGGNIHAGVPQSNKIIGSDIFSDHPGKEDIVLSQNSRDSGLAITKRLGDIKNSKSFADKGFDGLNGDDKRLVVDSMVTIGHNDKVLNAIVQLVPVNVMNMLGNKKLTPKMLFHNPSMFLNANSIINGDKPVSARTDITGAFIKATALTAAKMSAGLNSANLGGGFVDSNPAMSTIDDRHDITPNSSVVTGAKGASTPNVPPIISNKSSGIAGNKTEIILPDGETIQAEWQIVDANSIKASLKEGVNQPRDRSRAASDLQIKSIANKPDYRRLSDSVLLDTGSPTISNDGLIVAGNGRFEGVSQSHQNGTGTDYRDNLLKDALSKGIDPSFIEGMKSPVLVRRIINPSDTRKIAIKSNSGTSLQYSGLELAKIDADRMAGIEDLDITDSGDIALTGSNIERLKMSLGDFSPAELSSLVGKNGELSQDGVKRVRNAMLAKAYGNSETLGRIVESTDGDMRNVLGALTKSAGVVAKARSEISAGAVPKEVDITDNLLDAVETFSQIRAKNQPLENYLAQQSMFGDGIDSDSQEILQFLHDNVRSQKKLTEFIKQAYDQITRIDQTTDNIFGDNSVPSKSEIIKNAKQRAEGQSTEQQQGIFAAKSSEKTGGSDGQESKTQADNAGSGEESQQDDGLKFSRTPEERLKDRERAKQLETLLRKQGFSYTVTAKDVRDYIAGDRSKKAEADAAEKIAKIFGRRIVWIDARGDHEINGVIIGKIKDSIFIDINSAPAANAVMGHELSHHLEHDNPALYRDLVRSLSTVIKGNDKYAQLKSISGASQYDITKEIVGDIMGDNFTDPIFWNKVAEANLSAFKRIADAVMSWLKRLATNAKMRGLGSEQWVTDVNKAQDILAQAIAKYTDQPGSSTSDKAKFHAAFHGSPHDHNKFDSSKIGTGEGAQSYGFGHYFADSKEVAEWYKDKLSKDSKTMSLTERMELLKVNGQKLTDEYDIESDALFVDQIADKEYKLAAEHAEDRIERWESLAKDKDYPFRDYAADKAGAWSKLLPEISASNVTYSGKGKLYQVELAPKQDEYLLWDKPLSEQSEKVKSAVEDLFKKLKSPYDRYNTGGYVYEALSKEFKSKGGDKYISEEMHSLGIRGIKYLDGSSRAKGEGAFNYVIFSDNDIKITAKFSRASQGSLFGNNDNLASQEELLKQNSARPGDLFASSNTDTAKPEVEQNNLQEEQNQEDLIPETPAISKQNAPGKIEDFGQKLGNARKDMEAALRKEYTDADIASVPLSKIWPKEEALSIEDQFMAAFAYAAREEIPTKPKVSYKVKSWVEKVKKFRGMVLPIISGKITKERILDYSKNYPDLDYFWNKVQLLELIENRKDWSRIDSVAIYPDAYKYDASGIKVSSPYSSFKIDGRTTISNVTDIKELAESVNGALSKDAPEKLMQFEIRGRTGDYFINKKGDKEYRPLKRFTDLKEARSYWKDNYDDLVAAWESVKESDNVKKSDIRGEENRPRTGQDWRKGKDVTPEQFQDAFGFRGIEFGNWVSQGTGSRDRQGMLNQAYDALMDLSSIMGVPPKAMSLEGSLGLGFGSRGKGAALAHFEPGNLVINLTKTKGAGNLAHEFFHALDNYFQRKRDTDKAGFITYSPERMFVHKEGRWPNKYTKTALQKRFLQTGNKNFNPEMWIPDPKHPLGVRPEIEAKFSDLVQVLNESPMKQRAEIIDKGKADGYWSRIIERAARSFENYVIAKMMKSGYNNDYLANVTNVIDFRRDPGRYPYLLESEIAPVEEAFDNLFSEIKTKETDKGIAMFSRASIPDTINIHGDDGPKFSFAGKNAQKSILNEDNGIGNADIKTTEGVSPERTNSLDIPRESRFRKFQRKYQDSFNRFTVVKEWLADKGINVSQQADVYAAEERYHAKVANQVEDFREQIRNPLIEKIAKAGFTLDDIADYLEAQHAPEANEAIRKLRDDPEATAYGIADDEAKEYLSKAPGELGKLANELRSITEQTKKLRLDGGLLNKDITDAWEATYKHYIPVKGAEQGNSGTGKGMSVKVKNKRRLGHGRRDEAVIENILQDHERAIMEVEKNRVGKHVVMMAAEIGIPELMTIGQPAKRQMLRNTTAYEVQVKGRTKAVFDTKEGANLFRQSLPLTDKKIALSDVVINPTADQRVVMSASPMLADNEINVYIDGHAIRVQINDELMARAYKKLGIEGYGEIVSAGRMLNSYLSKVYTGYNPEFIMTNMVRDFTTGVINLTGEQGLKMAAKAISNYPKSFATLLRYAATNGKQSTDWIDAYRRNGGNTGAAYLSDMERLGNEVASEYAAYQGVIANLKQGDMANAARAAGRKAYNATLKWIYNLNQAGENAMRLSAFKAMIDSGMNVNDAAKAAKNITVNFNRKGEFGAEANAAYLFFNASVQGTAALAHALTKGESKGQAWALASSMAMLGYFVAASLGGGDEDDYDKLNDYVKERNLLIKAGDGYVQIPVPYGYGFFWNLGRSIADAQRKDELGKLPWHVASSAIEELTPFSDTVVGNDGEFQADQVFLGLLPTVAKIPAQPILNKQLFSGGELMPDSPFKQFQPDREKMWRATQGTMYDHVAGWLETGLGMDVSPETLKHYTRALTGGAGNMVDTTISATMLKTQGADLETSEIPFYRKAFTQLTIKDHRSAFFKARDEAKEAAEEFARAKEKNDLSVMKSVLSDKKEMIALDKYANKLSKVIEVIRNEQDSVRLSDNLTEPEKRLKIKELELREEKLYDQYLDVFKTKTAKN